MTYLNSYLGSWAWHTINKAINKDKDCRCFGAQFCYRAKALEHLV